MRISASRAQWASLVLLLPIFLFCFERSVELSRVGTARPRAIPVVEPYWPLRAHLEGVVSAEFRTGQTLADLSASRRLFSSQWVVAPTIWHRPRRIKDALEEIRAGVDYVVVADIPEAAELGEYQAQLEAQAERHSLVLEQAEVGPGLWIFRLKGTGLE